MSRVKRKGMTETDRRSWVDLVEAMMSPGPMFYYQDEDGASFWRELLQRPDVEPELKVIREEGKRLLAFSGSELTYSLFSRFEKEGSRLEYERVYFEKRRRMNTFAILSLLEPDSRIYETALLEAIWSICSELSWCLPAHVNATRPVSETIDLFSAETGFALAELCFLLHERLPEWLRVRVVELVDERLFRPFLEKGPYEWEEAEHNWSAVCAGSIGSAALLLLEGERLSQILEKTERSMTFYLRGFGDDGACLEGLGYWNYGFGYFVYYADLLLKRSDGQRDWFRNDKVRRIASFQQQCFLSGGLVVNFSDALPQGSVNPGLSHYLAERYPEVDIPPEPLYADYRDDHCSRFAPTLRNLIWRRAGGGAPADWSPGDFLLPDAGWFVSRISSGDKIFGFAAKAGHNGEPHNHNDLGHFLLAGGGEWFLCDLGSGEYTREYFGEGRYELDCNGSQGHSVPVIDGCVQSAGEERKAGLLAWAMDEGACRFVLDLSEAYKCRKLEAFKRTWVWEKAEPPRLSLRDEFRFAELPGSLTERFITLVRPEFAGPGCLHLSRGSLLLEVHYDHVQLHAEITERSFRDHFGRDAVWHTLDFQVCQPEQEMNFDFLFTFIDNGGKRSYGE